MLIDNQTFQLLQNTISTHGWLELPSFGTSMFPMILQGNICRFTSIDPCMIQKGDIILYCSEKGHLVAHRFYRKNKLNNKMYYIFKGDTNLGMDQPVEECRIIGKLIKVSKKNKEISLQSFHQVLWGKMLITFPLISAILRKYLNNRTYLQF